MSQASVTFHAIEQISVIAKALRTAAASQTDTELLPNLVLALTPRIIELTDLMTYVVLEDGVESLKDLRVAVFGLQTADAGA